MELSQAQVAHHKSFTENLQIELETQKVRVVAVSVSVLCKVRVAPVTVSVLCKVRVVAVSVSVSVLPRDHLTGHWGLDSVRNVTLAPLDECCAEETLGAWQYSVGTDQE